MAEVIPINREDRLPATIIERTPDATHEEICQAATATIEAFAELEKKHPGVVILPADVEAGFALQLSHIRTVNQIRAEMEQRVSAALKAAGLEG